MNAWDEIISVASMAGDCRCRQFTSVFARYFRIQLSSGANVRASASRMTYGRFIAGHFTDESLVTDSAAGETAGDHRRDAA